MYEHRDMPADQRVEIDPAKVRVQKKQDNQAMNSRPKLLRQTLSIGILRQSGLHSRLNALAEPLECLHSKLLVSGLRSLQFLRVSGQKN